MEDYRIEINHDGLTRAVKGLLEMSGYQVEDPEPKSVYILNDNAINGSYLEQIRERPKDFMRFNHMAIKKPGFSMFKVTSKLSLMSIMNAIRWGAIFEIIPDSRKNEAYFTDQKLIIDECMIYIFQTNDLAPNLMTHIKGLMSNEVLYLCRIYNGGIDARNVASLTIEQINEDIENDTHNGGDLVTWFIKITDYREH